MNFNTFAFMANKVRNVATIHKRYNQAGKGN